MSWRATAWASDQVTGSPISKAVLWKLADNANDQGRCWPSVPLIAAHTELSERTVQIHLGRLEALGLVAIERRFGDRGEPLPSIFQLNMPAASAAPAKAGKAARKGGAGDSPPPKLDSPGGAAAAPGGESEGVAYMEEPSTEPSIEPSTHTPAPAGASAREKIASLGKEDLAAWPAFRSAIADTWPDGFPNANETACKAEFAKLTRSTPAGVLIEIARLHGQALTRRAANRPKSAGRQLIKEPSNWLRSGDWQGYTTAAEEARKAEAMITTRLGNAQRGLGADLFDMLRNDLRMSDAALSWLADCTFEPGPPAVLLVAGGAAWVMLEKHTSVFQRRFGDGFRMQRITVARSA